MYPSSIDDHWSPLPLRERVRERGMSKITTQHAKSLRQRSTDAERFLWRYLRAKRFTSLKFRRQQPVGPYIVDFICFEKRIIIELDGGQHSDQVNRDKIRDSWLKDQGYQVLRFWNNDVLTNIHGVLHIIMTVCSKIDHL
jgi:very-short-patch-repair endonuclease